MRFVKIKTLTTAPPWYIYIYIWKPLPKNKKRGGKITGFIFHFLQTFRTVKNHFTNISKGDCISTAENSLNNINSYRASRIDLSHFLFYTPCTSLQNQKTIEFLVLLCFLGRGEVGGGMEKYRKPVWSSLRIYFYTLLIETLRHACSISKCYFHSLLIIAMHWQCQRQSTSWHCRLAFSDSVAVCAPIVK